MLSKNGWRGLGAGVLTALILVSAVWPVLAGDQRGWQPHQFQTPTFQEPGGQNFNGGSPHMVSAAAFSSEGTDPDSYRFIFAGGYLTGTSANNGCVKAPVYLPQGRTLSELFVSAYDNDDTYNLFLELRRVNNFTGQSNIIASVSSSGQFNGIRFLSDSTVNSSRTLYPEYSYYLTTCLNSGQIRLYSARIYMGSKFYLPMIIKRSDL
jgi:hypothetical protein